MENQLKDISKDDWKLTVSTQAQLCVLISCLFQNRNCRKSSSSPLSHQLYAEKNQIKKNWKLYIQKETPTFLASVPPGLIHLCRRSNNKIHSQIEETDSHLTTCRDPPFLIIRPSGICINSSKVPVHLFSHQLHAEQYQIKKNGKLYIQKETLTFFASACRPDSPVQTSEQQNPICRSKKQIVTSTLAGIRHSLSLHRLVLHQFFVNFFTSTLHGQNSNQEEIKSVHTEKRLSPFLLLPPGTIHLCNQTSEKLNPPYRSKKQIVTSPPAGIHHSLWWHRLVLRRFCEKMNKQAAHRVMALHNVIFIWPWSIFCSKG